MILSMISLWVLIILGFNLADYFITRKGDKPEYKLYFIARGFAAIVHGGLMLYFLQDDKTDYGSLNGWQLMVIWAPYVLFQVTSFWILYEFVRNWWTKRPAFYYDMKEKDSGLIDRFFAWAGWQFHLVAKLMAFAVCVMSIVVIMHR